MTPEQIDDLIAMVEAGGTVRITGAGPAWDITADNVDQLHTARAYAAIREHIAAKIDAGWIDGAMLELASPLDKRSDQGEH